MGKFLKKKLSYISFIFIPIVYLWDPNWLGFLGIQPYWPLIWLLPWCILYGSINGAITGLIVGLTLDSISPDSSFSQIPGLVLSGIWFGQFSNCRNGLVAHFRYGLICAMGSFLCGSLYFSQVLIKNLSNDMVILYFLSIKNIFSQVFITGLLAPLLCSCLLFFFKRSQEKNFLVNPLK